jgi:hypothetical protein
MEEKNLIIYPYNAYYQVNIPSVDTTKGDLVRNIETRRDTRYGRVKWLPIKYVNSNNFGWIKTEWIEKEVENPD